MRITITVFLTVVLGAAFGSAAAAWHFYRLPEQTSLQSADASHDPNEPHPKVEVDKEVHEFGSMDVQSAGTHDFTFRNVGTAPLELKAGRTTCKCTLSNIAENNIPPNGEGTVTLDWNAKSVGPYTQTATIITNDPARPTVDLRIEGEVTAKARPVPSELVFSSISAGRPATGEVEIYGYLERPLEIKGYDVDNPEHVEVSFTPMEYEEVKEEKYAAYGYRMGVTIKPGLPLGPFRRRIRVETNVDGLEEIFVPVSGTITSEISIVGPRWDAEDAVLRIGTFDPSRSVTKTLFIKVGGLRPEEVQFEVAEVQPKYVNVRILKRKNSSAGAVAITPIEIEIPKGSPPGNYLGPDRERFGHIRLKTNHETVKELDIYLQFLIRG